MILPDGLCLVHRLPPTSGHLLLLLPLLPALELPLGPLQLRLLLLLLHLEFLPFHGSPFAIENEVPHLTQGFF